MTNSNRLPLLAVLLAALFPVSLLAAAAPKYNAATEVTLQGDTLYVAEHPTRAEWTGLYAIMKEGAGEIEVHFAPGSFLADEGIEIHTGDTIKVVGSRTKWKGVDIILAREVTIKGKTVVLRDKDGKPRW
jgi:hypothetical protein